MRLVWVFLLTLPVAAAPLELSLKRAVEMAISPEGNTRVQLAAEAINQAESRSVQARAALLPDVSGAFSYQNLTRNLAALGIQVATPIPGFHIPAFVGPFSTMDARVSATQSIFDLGSYRSGDTPRSVVLTTPGVVEVFCNIHSKMNANILVVPGSLYTKVGADGTYRIENVPVGARRIVAWSPSAKPVQQKIEVGSGGGQANFTLDIEAAKAHTNKLGQPYGSYKE